MSMFDLGKIVATPASLDVIGNKGAIDLLKRHSRGDWGEVER